MRRDEVPSLVDLCVQKAIDNVRYLGDVGETDLYLLDRILSHCTMDQLIHIEDSTERDLSSITNKLWKKLYERQFGVKNTNVVVDRMRQQKVTFNWRKLYDAKLKAMEEDQERTSDRLRQLYKKEDDRKQSRQIRVCTKLPPGSKRSFFAGGPGSSICNSKSGLMKKAKLEFINSREVKNLASIKKTSVQMKKPLSVPVNNAASTSKFSKPMHKRF